MGPKRPFSVTVTYVSYSELFKSVKRNGIEILVG